MKDCLVTSMKSALTNESIEKLGTLKIGFPAGSVTAQKIASFAIVNNGEKGVSKVVSLGANLNESNLGDFSEVVLPFNTGGVSWYYLLSNFKTTSDNVTYFELENYYPATRFVFPNMLAEFDIMNLQYCKNCEIMRFAGTKVYGDVWEMFDGMVAQGRTSGTMRYSFNPTYCEHAPSTDSDYVTFTSNTTTYPRGWYLSDSSGNPLNG